MTVIPPRAALLTPLVYRDPCAGNANPLEELHTCEGQGYGADRRPHRRGKPPWSAGAGCGALATGLAETAWILGHLRQAAPGCPVFLTWDDFARSGRGLFLWEAFVSGAGKARGDANLHCLDAEAAALRFLEALPDPPSINAVLEPDVLSLIGAVLLRTGWTSDVRILARSCLVVRA